MPRTGSHTEVRPKCRKDSAVCAVPTYSLTREIIPYIPKPEIENAKNALAVLCYNMHIAEEMVV